MGIEHLRFWCQKVLPLVYDDSLSYYELLAKVVHYINDLIKQDITFGKEIEDNKAAIEKLNNIISNTDKSIIENIIKESIATMIFVEISNSGYVIYNIPESWNEITFNTTGLDITTELQPDYGHLVLSY